MVRHAKPAGQRRNHGGRPGGPPLSPPGALDWASRPYDKSTLTGKPVLTFTASPASTGGARAQAQLNETLTAIAAQLVLRPQTAIGAVHEKMSEGRFTDAKSLAFLRAGLADLVRDVRRNASTIRQES